MRNSIKRVRTTTDKTKAKAELTKTVKLLDQLAAKGVIHKNMASNQKSRLDQACQHPEVVSRVLQGVHDSARLLPGAVVLICCTRPPLHGISPGARRSPQESLTRSGQLRPFCRTARRPVALRVRRRRLPLPAASGRTFTCCQLRNMKSTPLSSSSPSVLIAISGRKARHELPDLCESLLRFLLLSPTVRNTDPSSTVRRRVRRDTASSRQGTDSVLQAHLPGPACPLHVPQNGDRCPLRPATSRPRHAHGVRGMHASATCPTRT